MAAYATESDLVVPAQALAMFSAGDKTDAIEKASALADSYLNAIFTLPLITYGDDLTDAVAAIATYRLMMKRGFAPQQGDSDQYEKRNKEAIAWLRDVGSGKAKPINVKDSSGVTAGTDPAGELSRAPVTLQAYPGRESPEDFWGHESCTSEGVGPPKSRGW